MCSLRSLGRNWNDIVKLRERVKPEALGVSVVYNGETLRGLPGWWMGRYFCDNKPGPRTNPVHRTHRSSYSAAPSVKSSTKEHNLWPQLREPGPDFEVLGLLSLYIAWSRQVALRWWSTWVSVAISWTVKSVWEQDMLEDTEKMLLNAHWVGDIFQPTNLWCHDFIQIGKWNIFSDPFGKPENRNPDRAQSCVRAG